MPADGSEPHVGAILAQKTVLSLRKPIAACAHRLRATQSPPTNADVRRRMGPLGAGLLRTMHDPASAVLMWNRPKSEAPQGAATLLPGTSRCAEIANEVVATLHNHDYRRIGRTSGTPSTGRAGARHSTDSSTNRDPQRRRPRARPDRSRRPSGDPRGQREEREVDTGRCQVIGEAAPGLVVPQR